MTQRIKGITITFSEPMREDDAKPFLQMLHSLKAVVSVNPIEDVPSDMIAVQAERSRICHEMMSVIFNTKRKP